MSMKSPSWTALISKARKAKGLTQQQLADAIGVHYVTMSKIERAKTDVSLEQMVRIAEILNIRAADLFMSAPYTQALNFKGWIQNGGNIKNNDKDVEVVLAGFVDPFTSKKYEWFDVQTSDFYPVLHEGDRIRAEPIGDNDIEMYLDRLCLFHSMRDPDRRVIGILSYGMSLDVFAPRALNGKALPLEDPMVWGYVSMILPSLGSPTELHVA